MGYRQQLGFAYAKRKAPVQPAPSYGADMSGPACTIWG
jgi:hypothetical protein